MIADAGVALTPRELFFRLALVTAGLSLACWHVGVLAARLISWDGLAIPMWPLLLNAGAFISWLIVAALNAMAIRHVRFRRHSPWLAMVRLGLLGVAAGCPASMLVDNGFLFISIVSLMLVLVPAVSLPLARYFHAIVGNMAARRAQAGVVKTRWKYLVFLPLSLFARLTFALLRTVAYLASWACTFIVRAIRWSKTRALTTCRAKDCGRVLSDPYFRCSCAEAEVMNSHASLTQPLYAVCNGCQTCFPLWRDWGEIADAEGLSISLLGCGICHDLTAKQNREVIVLGVAETAEEVAAFIDYIAQEFDIDASSILPLNRIGLPVTNRRWTRTEKLTVPTDPPFRLSLTLRYQDDRPIWAGRADIVVFFLPVKGRARRETAEYMLRTNALPLPGQNWGQAETQAQPPGFGEYIRTGPNQSGSERFLRSRPIRVFCWKGRTFNVNNLQIRNFGKSSLGEEIRGVIQ